MLLNFLEISGVRVVLCEYSRASGAIAMRGPALSGLAGACDAARAFMTLAPTLPGAHHFTLTLNSGSVEVSANLHHPEPVFELGAGPLTCRTVAPYDFKLDSAEPNMMSDLRLQLHRSDSGWSGRVTTEHLIMDESPFDRNFDAAAYARRHAEKHRGTPFNIFRREYSGEWSSVFGHLRSKIAKVVTSEVLETSHPGAARVFSVKMTADLALS